MNHKMTDLRHPRAPTLEIVQAQDTGMWVAPGGRHYENVEGAEAVMEKLAKKAGYIEKSMIGV